MKTLKKQSFDCPECGEQLTLDKVGSLVDKNETQTAARYFCTECDQSFAIVEGVLHFVAFDAAGKPLKELHCVTCDKPDVYRQRMVQIIFEDMFYKPFCVDCAVEFLRNNYKDAKKDAITRENVHGVADVYCMGLQNAVLSDPVKMQKVVDNPAWKRAMKELGLDETTLQKRGSR